MKKPMYVHLMSATMLAIILTTGACARKVQKSPLETADPKVDSPADVDASQSREKAEGLSMNGKAHPEALPAEATKQADSNVHQFALLGSYQGPVVTLAVPSEKKWGHIRLNDDDAKALYNSLRVKAVPTQKNQNYAAGTAKSGVGVRCFKGAELKTPNVEEYACSIYFNYVEGSITAITSRAEFDQNVPALATKYTGKNLILNPSSRIPSATIRLSGLDAQAVYTALKSQGQLNADQLDATAMERKGKNISCVRSLPSASTEAVYKCSLTLNAESGAIAVLDEPVPSTIAPF